MNRKRFLKVGAFLSLTVATLLLPGVLMKPKTMNRFHLDAGRAGVFSRIKLEPRNSIDVVVLGDSESYSSFSPMQLWKDYGYTSYVAGVPGAKIGENLDVLRTVLKRQQPKVVMLETNNLFRYQPPGSVEQGTTKKIYQMIPLLKYHSAWKSPLLMARGALFQGFNINGGVKPYKGGRYMYPSKEKEKIEATNRKCFEEIARLCQKKKIQLMLYSAPSPRNYNYKKHNALEELAREHHLPYVDLNVKASRLEIDWRSDTRDRGDHLNLSGARKATEFLGYYLNRRMPLTCRWNDKISKRWNMMLKDYNRRERRVQFSIWRKVDDWEEEVDNELF